MKKAKLHKTLAKKGSFKYPSLKEAICEFHFGHTEKFAWDSSYPGKLLQRLQDSYPNFETLNEMAVRFKMQEGILAPQIFQPVQKFKYSSAINSNCIILTKNTFALSATTERYEYDWEEFKKILFAAWDKIKKVIKINSITRIGLRYINHIPLENNETPNKWLKEGSIYLPANILTCNERIMVKNESQKDKFNSTNIGLALVSNPNKNKSDTNKIIIFDIDKIYKGNTADHKKELLKIIESLHTEVDEIFFSSITENLKAKMEG